MPGTRLFEVLADSVRTPPRCDLEEEYGGALRLDPARVAVNFVSTIDGVVSLGLERDDSRAVGGGVPADRLLMAMLRAVAGVILVGAATLRATRNHQWTYTATAPGRASELAQLRQAAGRPTEPAPLLVVSASGSVPADADAVARPAVPLHVLSPAGLDVHPRPHPPSPEPDGTWLSAEAIVGAAHSLARGGPVLCEGGAHLLGSLVRGAVPLDLFLTVAPQLSGRSDAATDRRSLVEGVAVDSFGRPATLTSVRRAGEHLLLRYAVGESTA